MEHYFTNNENIKSELRTITYQKESTVFSFFSDNGVFSKDKIDYGSRVLLDSILEIEQKRNAILDVGCGYGFLGIVLSKILDAPVTLCDVNKRALHLAEKNIEQNKVNGKAICSNAYENIEGQYDLIVTNPPIRAGNVVVKSILRGAIDYLSEDGVLYFVIRKDQGAKSMMKACEDLYTLEILQKNKGFYVIQAKKR